MKRRAGVIGLLIVVLTSLALAKSESVDFEFGKPGAEPGQLSEVRDLVAAHGHLYVLEGRRVDRKTGESFGNMRVQVFDPSGKSLSIVSLGGQPGGAKANPVALAVDGGKGLWIADAGNSVVDHFDATGKLVRTLEVPDVSAIAIRRTGAGEQLLVATNPPHGKLDKKGERPAISELAAFDIATGEPMPPLALGRPISDCVKLATDSAGNVYAKAAINRVYKFNPTGAPIVWLGAGTSKRLEDTSELVHDIAVDSKQRIYAMTPGNPGLVCRFEPDGATALARRGQYAFADSWGYGTSLHFAVDENDRLWFASDSYPGRKPDPKKHTLPVVMRVEASFFDGPKGVTRIDTRSLGLVLSAESKLAYNVGYELAETPIDLVVSAGMLRVHDVELTYAIYDTFGNAVASERLPMKLADLADVRHAIKFTPPKWGWYGVVFDVRSENKILRSGGCHLGFTPRYGGMPVMNAGDSPGGWGDGLRQVFVGMPLIRLHPAEKLDGFEKQLVSAEKAGATVFAQFSDLKLCTPEFVTSVVTQYKDRVKHWEIMNEPNFSMSAEKYADLVAQLSPLIKQIDPQAQVMGADHCGMDIAWYRRFYERGGHKFLDIVSVHDYEGHESMDQFHWPWKYGELRKLMTEFGDQDKPVWQTERCFSVVRGHTFLGAAHAVRVTLHQDVLETLGVPTGHNQYYYVNQAGYIPVYLWSRVGPHPAAMATRTRYAMTSGRAFGGKLDLGASGNRTMLALPFVGKDGTTLICRNYGADDLPLTLQLAGAAANVEVIDAFGNASSVPVVAGRVTIITQPLAQYLRLPPGVTATAIPVDYGRNLAAQVTFSYSSNFFGQLESLANGWFESPHGGDPRRGLYFNGECATLPQSLEMKLPHVRTLNRVVLYSLRADNAQSAILDYDVEYFSDGEWRLAKQVRTPLQPSVVAKVEEADAFQWYGDENFSVAEFDSVRTDRLRLVIRRTTFGLIPDEAAKLATKSPNWKGNVLIREIELYGPADEVALTGTRSTGADNVTTIALSGTNRRQVAVEGTLEIKAPDGYAVEPSRLASVTIPAGGTASWQCTVTSPAQVVAGRTPLTVTLTDVQGHVVDFDQIDIGVDAPALVIPRPVVIKADKAVCPVEVRNLGTTPIAGVVRMSVRGADSTQTPDAKTLPFTADAGKTIKVEFDLVANDATNPQARADIDVTVGAITVRRGDVPFRTE